MTFSQDLPFPSFFSPYLLIILYLVVLPTWPFTQAHCFFVHWLYRHFCHVCDPSWDWFLLPVPFPGCASFSQNMKEFLFVCICVKVKPVSLKNGWRKYPIKISLIGILELYWKHQAWLAPLSFWSPKSIMENEKRKWKFHNCSNWKTSISQSHNFVKIQEMIPWS